MNERVASVEGRLEDHHGTISELRADVRELRVEIRELRGEMNQLCHALDTKINWVIGGQLAIMLAVVGALLKR